MVPRSLRNLRMRMGVLPLCRRLQRLPKQPGMKQSHSRKRPNPSGRGCAMPRDATLAARLAGDFRSDYYEIAVQALPDDLSTGLR